MPKNKTMASYILKHDLDIHTADIVLKHFSMYSNHPDADKFKVSDVHNGLKLIKEGFTLDQDEQSAQPVKRKRSNPLKRGSMIDFAKCIADEGDRFSVEEKALILQTLKASWGVA